PLFLIVFVVELFRLWMAGRQIPIEKIPLYLTFTQSWVLAPTHGIPAYDVYGGATSAMWSLSTEAFFYLVYPLLALVLIRMRGLKLVSTIVVTGLLALCLSVVAARNVVALQKLGAEWYGQEDAEQFFHFLTFNSPYLRIFEFLSGALAAQIFMTNSLSETA